MQSAIGQSFQTTPARSVAVILATGTVSLDLFVAAMHLDPAFRWTLALLGFALLVYLTDGDLVSLGLRFSPWQGWRLWIRWSLVIGGLVAGCIAIGFGVWKLTGHDVPVVTTPPKWIVYRLPRMCIFAPVLEETIYRLVLCVGLVRAIGCWPTIAASGLAFGALHVAYGNPSPENLVGGFFLAWAFLKSESIVVPLILHSAGNGIVLAGQVAGWYVIHTGA